jgi:hypothetical protein
MSRTESISLDAPSDVYENEGKVTIGVRRIGDVDSSTTVTVFTSDREARAGVDCYLRRRQWYTGTSVATLPIGGQPEFFRLRTP